MYVKNRTKDKILEFYNSQEHGFTTAKVIAKHLNMKEDTVKKVLDKHSQVYNQSKRGKAIVRKKWTARFPGEILHADIMFLKPNSTNTSAHKHPVLIVVDVYSRYVWLFKIPQKSAVLGPFKKIIEDINSVRDPDYIDTVPIKVVTDGGTEFKPLSQFDEIEHIESKSVHKASIAEGNIARVKRLLAKIGTIQVVWEDVQKNLNTVQKEGVGQLQPYDVFFKGVKKDQPEQVHDPNEKQFKLYDIVRKNNKTSQPVQFEKQSNKLTFSKELYQIISISSYDGKRTYVLRELGSSEQERIESYGNELQLVDIEFLKKYK
jgi:hypothetical protein